MNIPIISADSHITEPPNAYVDNIDPAWRDRAPRLVDGGEVAGDVFEVQGMRQTVPMGLISAAGRPAEELQLLGMRFDRVHRGGWDPDARLLDQDRDGIAAEVLYPSVGMQLCLHPDFDFKKACFDAYNRWLADFCGAHPHRLIGCGQTAMRSPEEGIADIRRIKAMGLRGVMMPGDPAVEDYDSPIYDDFWRAAIELGLPLSFHILTSANVRTRGPKANRFLSIVRGCQDILGMLVLGGVFERHPDLRVVCVEADAGWVPHFMYRMDHGAERHANWLPPGQPLSRKPSEYFRENIYVTFQDDWTAFRQADDMNWRRLMWANDFPHSDSTWPDSQDLLARHIQQLTPEQRQAILCGNVADLYSIDLSRLTATELPAAS